MSNIQTTSNKSTGLATVNRLTYKGKLLNSTNFSPEQSFLIRCRSGVTIKEATKDQIADLINYISTICGKKYESKEQAIIEADEFGIMLLKNYPNIFLNEIKGCYYLADKKRLPDENGVPIKLYQQLSYRATSDLIHAFDLYFKESFKKELQNGTFWYDEDTEQKKEIDQSQMYESFKRSLQIALDMVKDGREFSLPGSDIFIYDTLKKLKVIDLSDEEKDYEIQFAYNELKAKWNAERVSGANIGRRMELGKLIEDLMPEDVRVLNQAKRNFLAKQLKIWVEFGNTVEEIIS